MFDVAGGAIGIDHHAADRIEDAVSHWRSFSFRLTDRRSGADSDSMIGQLGVPP